ncbi:hypothetical protein AHAS_Ahas17G0121700 [Arachis hypogaea]
MKFEKKIDTYFTAAFNARVQTLKSQLKSTKKTASTSEYLAQIRKIVNFLFAIGYVVPEDDHLQEIFYGLSEEYSVYIGSVMSKLDSYRVVEVEPYLLAFENMLDRFKKLDIALPIANFAQSSMAFNDGRGGFTHHGIVAAIQEEEFSTSFTPQSNNFPSQFQIPYGNSQPPPPPPSFHQPRASISIPSSINEAAWLPDSGASHYITNDVSNLLTSYSNQPYLDQLYVGNEATWLPC